MARNPSISGRYVSAAKRVPFSKADPAGTARIPPTSHRLNGGHVIFRPNRAQLGAVPRWCGSGRKNRKSDACWGVPLAGEWQALSTRCGDVLFQRHDFMRLWLQHFAADAGLAAGSSNTGHGSVGGEKLNDSTRPGRSYGRPRETRLLR